MISKKLNRALYLTPFLLVVGVIIYVIQYALIQATDSNQILPDLRIGGYNLSQKVDSRNVKEGLILHRIVRGDSSDSDYFTLVSNLLSKDNLNDLHEKFVQLGYEAYVVYSAEKGPDGEDLGGYIQVGKFNSKIDADRFKEDNSEVLGSLSVRFTAENGHPTSGPFQISLLEIDLRKFSGDFMSALPGNQVKGLSTVSEVANRNDAIVAVNGGYFAWQDSVGVPGDPAGISIIDGRIVSEAVAGRPALLLRSEGEPKMEIIDKTDTIINLKINNSIYRAHGINREPGKVLNCGSPLDPDMGVPVHDFVCKNENEVIVITRDYGQYVNLDSGKVISVDNGIVSDSRYLEEVSKMPIPDNGFLISVNGTNVDEVDAKVGDYAELDFAVVSDGSEVHLKSGMYAVNGGPLLIKNGRITVNNRGPEGWDVEYVGDSVTDRYVDKNDDLGTAAASDAGAAVNELNRADFYHAWAVRRHPRTAVGITEDGKAYIITIYGRQPRVSAGASITEVANALDSLGSEWAINLDGGGSTMMVVNGKPTGISSDKKGEREVGDVLLLQ
jgi:hypothetical protein